MTDKKKDVNPFEDFITGTGGFWEAKVVTVLASKTVDLPLSRGSGEPVMRDGAQVHFKGLEIEGIAEDTEVPRREGYSCGGTLNPSPDGETFVNVVRPDHPDDATKPVRFHVNSAMAKLCKALKESGFPIERVFVDGKMKWSGLVGAQFIMEGVQKKNDKGELKTNAKGFPEYQYFPKTFVGFKAGLAPTAVSDELSDKATAMVVKVLKGAGGAMGRADLVRGITRTFAGDPDVNKVIALITREEFHRGAPWTREGSVVKLT